MSPESSASDRSPNATGLAAMTIRAADALGAITSRHSSRAFIFVPHWQTNGFSWCGRTDDGLSTVIAHPHLGQSNRAPALVATGEGASIGDSSTFASVTSR